MSSTGHPLSPPGGQHGMPQLVAPRPQGLDSNQLKARLYAKSEIHTSTRPVLKVVRRRPRKDEVRIVELSAFAVLSVTTMIPSDSVCLLKPYI